MVFFFFFFKKHKHPQLIMKNPKIKSPAKIYQPKVLTETLEKEVRHV